VGHDDVDPQAYKLSGQDWQAIERPLRPAVLDNEISALLVTAIPETPSKRGDLAVEIRGRSLSEKAKPVDSIRRLRPGHERHEKQREDNNVEAQTAPTSLGQAGETSHISPLVFLPGV